MDIQTTKWDQTIRGWFNAQAYHSLPTAVLYADRYMLATIAPNATITTSNHPLPPTTRQSFRKNTNFNMQGKDQHNF
jgi:hypothetical protein